MDTSMKRKKSQDGGGNNAYKIIVYRVEEGNIICKHKIVAVYSYNEKETIFWIVKKLNSMKPKSWDRYGDSVKRIKNCKNLSCKEVSFNNKRSSRSILKGPRKINNQ